MHVQRMHVHAQTYTHKCTHKHKQAHSHKMRVNITLYIHSHNIKCMKIYEYSNTHAFTYS